MITVEKALATVLSSAQPLKTTRTSLCDASGCCLADDIRADRDLPPTDRSAMDGYAVRAADLTGAPCELRLVGEVAAGSSKRPKVTAGTCVTILTGAGVPPGADTVVKVEETKEKDGVVTFLASAKRGQNIRVRAEEVKKGIVILPRHTVLDAVQIGLCASVGKARLRVYRRPTVTVLCTGRELRSAEARVLPHQLRDSNGPSLQGALKSVGCENVPRTIVPDEPRALCKALKAATAKHDIVILTGGVSVGKYDFVPGAITQIGAKIRFHGVSMKPGKPQLYATLSRNRHIFALPGNPLSVLNGFYEFVLPAIRRMSGVPAEYCCRKLALPLTQSVRARGKGREVFVLAKLVRSAKGLGVCPVDSRGSADLVAAGRADGVFVMPRGADEAPAGLVVKFQPWRELL